MYDAIPQRYPVVDEGPGFFLDLACLQGAIDK
jgi:hypothetical protein